MSTRSIDSAAILFGQGLNTLINLLFLPYLSRTMSLTEYGTYGQVILVVDFCAIVFQFGLYKIIYLFYSDASLDPATVLRNNLTVSFLSGLIPTVGLSLFSDTIGDIFENPGLATLLPVYCWSIPLALASQSLVATLVYFKRIQRSVKLAIISNIVKVGLIFIAVQVFGSLFLVFLGMLVSLTLQFVFAFYWAPDVVKGGSFDRKLAIRQVVAGFPIGLTGVMGTGFRYIDGIVVSLFLTTQDYAVYRNGAFELPFINALAASIGAAILPDLAILYNKGDYERITELKKKSIRIAAAVMIPVVVFILFFGKPLIVTYLSEKYAESSPVFIIYSLILLIRVTDYQSLFVVSGQNKPQVFIYGFIFILNLILNVILIKIMGITGPAVAAVVCNFILAYMLLKYSNRYIGKKWSDFFDTRALTHITFLSIAVALPFAGLWCLAGREVTPVIVALIFVLYITPVFHFILKYNLMENATLYHMLTKMRVPTKLTRFFHKLYIDPN
ncbi:MAG: oligosaccharide flippase family protein [Saprospiraceae bacterium]|nr:oligosaccharide flippase family protein [Saprospiraceae bacterium]